MISINLYEIVMQMVNFLILLWILKRFVFTPLGAFLDNRRQQISEDINSAEANRAESEKLISEQKNLLEEARKEAKEIRVSAETSTKKERDIILSQARQESEQLLSNSKKEVELTYTKVKKQLIDEVGKLSIDLSKQILDRDMNQDDQKKILDDYLEKIKG